jgi:DNA repair and recombination protein RAD52
MFTDEINKALTAPLDPSKIKPPPKGKYGEYVDGFHVITEANRIFGFDGWSYSITMMEICSRVETVDAKQQPQVRVGYRCTVRAEVGGVYREGAAVGSGMSRPENEADAHESALKEAETDALKRALRSFGYTFGLALYDKTQANVQAPEPEREPTLTDDQQAVIINMLSQMNVPVGDFLAVGNWRDVRDVPASQFELGKKWINKEARKRAAPEQKAA